MMRNIVQASAAVCVVNLWSACLGQIPITGDYTVGHRQLTLIDPARNDRSLVVDMWYPGVSSADSELTRYHVAQSVDFTYPTDAAYSGLSMDLTQAFPLLISSHGTTLYSTSQAGVNEIMASHGFVVVAPNHTGNSRDDEINGTGLPETAAARDRILDVRFLIDSYLSASADSEGLLGGGTVDPERVGVLGLSYGGVTTFASHLGAMGIPEDDRVKAIMPITAGGYGWMNMNTGDLPATIPTLLVNGTNDFTRSQSLAAFDVVKTDHRYLAQIEDAEHLSYSDVCEWREYGAENDAPVSLQGYFDFVATNQDYLTCEDVTIDNEAAIELTGQMGVAFFRAFLNGEDDYLQYLSPDYYADLPVRFSNRSDVTKDGAINQNDIDRLHRQLFRGRFAAQYDIDRDADLDQDDLSILIHEGLNTYFGDANLDGEFNSGDLVDVFQAGEYEDGVEANSSWDSGDWNGDGEFDTGDLVRAFQDGGFEKGPRESVATVPEPSGTIMEMSAVLFLGVRRRRKSN